MAALEKRSREASWGRNAEAWQALFSNPSQWWDYRHSKRNPNYPDFRHKASREPLWLDSPIKPAWVDSLLPSLSSAPLSRHFDSLLHHGHFHRALDLLSHMDPLLSQGMYLSLFRSCNRSKSLPLAKLILSHISAHRLPLTGLLGDSLVVTLAVCGCLEDAHELFSSLLCRTVFSWTAMISGHVDCGKFREALHLYSCMLEDGVEPNSCTFVALFKACRNSMDIREGRKLHAEAHEKGFTSDIFVASSLLSMYGKCGDISQAEIVFEQMHHHDNVTWGVMLCAYIDDGQGEKALQLYRQMHEEGGNLYKVPLVFAVQACCILAEKEKSDAMQGALAKAVSPDIGRALHADAQRESIASDCFVGSTLLNLYSKLQSIVEAESVFRGLDEPDVVAWSAMLSAYVEHGQGDKALQLYIQMQQQGVSPNQLTFVFAFQACGILADKEESVMVNGCSTKWVSLEIGQALHMDAKSKGFTSDLLVGSSLVSMYGKCGAILEAEAAFGDLQERDIVTWTTMLSAYVQECLGDKALQFYTRMQTEDVVFTDVTLVSVLQACRGYGSLEIVRQLHFGTVSSWHDASRLFANTLVHAYGTCGSMVEAQTVFDRVSQPDAVTWSACIAGYSQEGNYTLCVQLFHKMQLSGLKPDRVTFLSLLSAFRHAGLVFEAVEYFTSMDRDFDVTPTLKHYAVMIDLMARAGNLKGVERIIQGMPEKADMYILLGLLGSCRTHGNLELGRKAFGHAVDLQPMEASAYILMSNLYADAAEVQDG